MSNQLPFPAGSTQRCVHDWAKIIDDSYILNAVSHCHTEFDHEPDQQVSTTRPHSSWAADYWQWNCKVLQWCNLQRCNYRSTVSEPGDNVSPIFVTPKKGGSHRIIFNLEKLNDWITYHHFKLDTLHSASQLIKLFCFLTSIDLKGAYYHHCNRALKYLKIFGRMFCMLLPVYGFI